MNKFISKTLAGSMLVMLPMLFGSVSAAEAKPDSLADVWIMVPNPGQSEKFEQAFIKHIKFRAEKGDSRPWKTYVPVVGKNLNAYVVRFCCTTFNDVEGYEKWENDSKAQDDWNKNVAMYVAHYEHYFSRVDFKNSSWPEGDQGFKYFGVTEYMPKMGKGKSISEGKKVLSDNAKAMKWQYSWAWSWQIGGDEHMSLVIPYKNYAGMTPPDKSFATALSEHLGDEAKSGAIFQQWSDNFHATNYTVYRLRDDMSMTEE